MTSNTTPQYEIIDRCGAGAYGEVFRVKECTGRYLALKKIDKKRLSECWKNEFNGLQNYTKLYLNHPHLISIYHVFVDENFLYYLFELADNRSTDPDSYIPDTLQARIDAGEIDYNALRNIALGLFSGIETLHEHGVVHHDIKPQNIIYIKGEPKLSDIGLCSATYVEHDLYGTKGFLPPEITYTPESQRPLWSTPTLDLYAFGKLLYVCLTGRNPNDFPSINMDILEDKQLSKVNQLSLDLCNANPNNRITQHREIHKKLTQIFSPPLAFYKKYKYSIILATMLVIVMPLLFFRFTEHRKMPIQKTPFERFMQNVPPNQKDSAIKYWNRKTFLTNLSYKHHQQKDSHPYAGVWNGSHGFDYIITPLGFIDIYYNYKRINQTHCLFKDSYLVINRDQQHIDVINLSFTEPHKLKGESFNQDDLLLVTPITLERSITAEKIKDISNNK